MSSPSAFIKVNYLVMRYLHFGSVRGDLQEGHDYASWCQSPLFPSTKSGFLCQNGRFSPCFRHSRAQNRHFCARVTEDAYGDVGLEVVNMGLGKRKARIFWVCALLLICLAARSAILPGVPFYPECRSTRSAAPPPAGQGTKGQETKSRGTKAGERRAWERRAGGFTGGRG